ncbi:hypothetical protein [Phytohabitans houttuyneae]|uniref:Bacterial transcriptional activator domain-containing protein n=2 Tax=Phytohabitans houttuyneae TaxID=1076126 RepID=A0A6V8KJS8_9ACTN|nr:hypothetical protein [Phytohabitans houttuyneae]GFJ83680.1 hypothetical protein Phou_078600 [Phytohabitans houttuyneae]
MVSTPAAPAPQAATAPPPGPTKPLPTPRRQLTVLGRPTVTAPDGTSLRIRRTDSLQILAHLALIQDAINVDPYNEHLYQRAIGLHGRLNNPDGIRTTLRTLNDRLRQLQAGVSERTRRLAAEQLAEIERGEANAP